MSAPEKKHDPSLYNVVLELTRALSSLNMPTPEKATAEDVKHAYEHLEAALYMASILQAAEPPPKPRMREQAVKFCLRVLRNRLALLSPEREDALTFARLYGLTVDELIRYAAEETRRNS